MSEWIEWSGVGTLSAAQERLMDVRLRDGTHRYGISVSSWRWWHEGAPGDIMAYRIIEPKSDADGWIEWNGDADGWIEWNGGDCPVNPGARIQVLFRGGDAAQKYACDFAWAHDGAMYDIIAYRVIQHPAPVEPKPETGVDATLAERGARYGAFRDNAGVAQSIKAILDGHPRWHTLTACQREALHHIASKIARIMNGDSNYLDNWHDIACYATLVEKDINEGSEK